MVVGAQRIAGGNNKLWIYQVDTSVPGKLTLIQEKIGGKDSLFKYTDQTTAYYVNKKGLEGRIGTYDESEINKAAMEE